MKTDFTPGPWALHEGGTSVIDAEGKLVASCGFLPHKPVWVCGANANLIAAAPEMYEIIRDLIFAYERNCYGDNVARLDWVCDVVEDANRLISKLEEENE